MDIIYVILPLSILLAVVALAGFAWALRREQFEDLETPAVRVLFDETGSVEKSIAEDSGLKTPSEQKNR